MGQVLACCTVAEANDDTMYRPPPKGQLISKCPFGVIVWTKTPTNFNEDFCPSLFITLTKGYLTYVFNWYNKVFNSTSF